MSLRGGIAQYLRMTADVIEETGLPWEDEEYDPVDAGVSPDMTREELEAYRDAQVDEQVNRAYDETVFYQELLDDAGVDPDDITSVADLARVPPTTGDDLAQAELSFPDYPFLGADWEDVYRPHESSGTGGGPTKQYFVSHEDREAVAEDYHRVFEELGLTADDRFLVPLPYGLNTSGFSAHEGIDQLGALEIQAGVMAPPEAHASMVEAYEPTAMIALNSYASRFANVLEKEGIDPAETSLEHIIVGGEAFSDQRLSYLEDTYDAQVTQVYGLTEAGGIIGAEAAVGNGMHIFEDNFVVEIVDEDGVTEMTDGARRRLPTLPDGEAGEVLLTPLDRTGTPLLRYAPGDMGRFKTKADGADVIDTPFRRIDTPWRKKDVADIEGVEIYPSMVSEHLFDIDEAAIDAYGLNEEFRIDLDFDADEQKHYMDIKVEAAQQDEEVERLLHDALNQVLEFHSIQQQDVADITVSTVPLGELQVQGKAEYINDRRDL